MPSNKSRLYIALYARAGDPRMPKLEDTYHWAFIVGPKTEREENARGFRFHARERLQIIDGQPRSVWEYEERDTTLQLTSTQLVRIMIGKIENMDRLKTIFRNTPIRAGTTGYEHWNCVEWIKEALALIHHYRDALGTSQTNWDYVRDIAMWYVEKKKSEHRFDGQMAYDQTKAATWDVLTGKELVP